MVYFQCAQKGTNPPIRIAGLRFLVARRSSRSLLLSGWTLGGWSLCGAYPNFELRSLWRYEHEGKKQEEHLVWCRMRVIIGCQNTEYPRSGTHVQVDLSYYLGRTRTEDPLFKLKKKKKRKQKKCTFNLFAKHKQATKIHPSAEDCSLREAESWRIQLTPLDPHGVVAFPQMWYVIQQQNLRGYACMEAECGDGKRDRQLCVKGMHLGWNLWCMRCGLFRSGGLRP